MNITWCLSYHHPFVISSPISDLRKLPYHPRKLGWYGFSLGVYGWWYGKNNVILYYPLFPSKSLAYVFELHFFVCVFLRSSEWPWQYIYFGPCLVFWTNNFLHKIVSHVRRVRSAAFVLRLPCVFYQVQIFTPKTRNIVVQTGFYWLSCIFFGTCMLRTLRTLVCKL